MALSRLWPPDLITLKRRLTSSKVRNRIVSWPRFETHERMGHYSLMSHILHQQLEAEVWSWNVKCKGASRYK